VKFIKKYCGRAWTGFIWLRIETSGRLFEFHNCRRIFCAAERLLDSQEGLCFLEQEIKYGLLCVMCMKKKVGYVGGRVCTLALKSLRLISENSDQILVKFRIEGLH
jgi:hypothetical protein